MHMRIDVYDKWQDFSACLHILDVFPWDTAHKWQLEDLTRDSHMGKVLEQRATLLLQLGIPYNGEVSEFHTDYNRFEVSRCLIKPVTFQVLELQELSLQGLELVPSPLPCGSLAGAMYCIG